MKMTKRKTIIAVMVFTLTILHPSLISSQSAEDKKAKPVATDPAEESMRKEIEFLKLQKEYLEAKSKLEEEQKKLSQQKINDTINDLRIKNALEDEKTKDAFRKFQQENNDIQLELNKIRLESTKKIEDMKNLETRIFQMETQIKKQKKTDEIKNMVIGEVRYPANPLQGRKIVISDRKMELDGPITYDSAAEIVRLIDFYNNQSDSKPIFLVIESSPGGSVMAGYQILSAMKSSRAPIYVVVKSYAASMAAVITTSADKSYALDHAIILHHQIRGDNYGNITQQKEMLKFIEEWSERIMGPVAKKMGITTQEFIKKMYAHNSDGDWMEFADGAVKIKWITGTISEIEDHSIRMREEMQSSLAIRPGVLVNTKTDIHQEKKSGALPPLRPFDVYHLYDPYGQYSAGVAK